MSEAKRIMIDVRQTDAGVVKMTGAWMVEGRVVASRSRKVNPEDGWQVGFDLAVELLSMAADAVFWRSQQMQLPI